MTDPAVTVASRPKLALFRPWGLLGLLSLLALACAASIARRPEEQPPASGMTDADLRAVEGAEHAMRQAEGELDSSKATPAPDCARACVLASNVCALAERICAVAARYPADDLSVSAAPMDAPDAHTLANRCRTLRLRSDSADAMKRLFDRLVPVAFRGSLLRGSP